ncbi:hypothetical protein [Nocardia arthritidis]|uniref:Uncharacterized protein n=1 Tax=Nocardia arthritidis TaxID=228602 RepID=A0A6G9YK62_9NOCA|nr:hypothetical protein [Nocardia arthritidis]QIS13649.1 hypothetical protein F5544_29020 [Nocardia arthritidis]
MRVFRDNHDHNDDDHDNDGREPIDPRTDGEILADEFADYLALAAEVADNPPPPDPLDEPTTIDRPRLRLVTTGTDTLDETDDADPWAKTSDPDYGRTARRRLVRGAAGGSAVVVGLGALAGWGEPFVVVGPLTAYGLGWLAYLWWHAALRPTIPQVLATAATGTGHAIAAIATTLVALLRAVVSRIEDARDRHENHRTATT